MNTLRRVGGRGEDEEEGESEMGNTNKRLKAANSRKHFYVFIP